MKRSTKHSNARVPTAGAGSRIAARIDLQRPNNSYAPKLYYEDKKFRCRDCGLECVWTAEQQRLWYEEWKGPIQSTAVRCRGCRLRLRQEKAIQRRHMQALARRVRAQETG